MKKDLFSLLFNVFKLFPSEPKTFRVFSDSSKHRGVLYQFNEDSKCKTLFLIIVFDDEVLINCEREQITYLLNNNSINFLTEVKVADIIQKNFTLHNFAFN